MDRSQSSFGVLLSAFVLISAERSGESTHRGARSALNHYLQFNQDIDCQMHGNARSFNAMVKRHWQKFVAFLDDEGLQSTSVNTVLAHINRAITYAADLGYPMPRPELIRVDTESTKDVWPDEVVNTIMESNHHFAPWVRFHIATCARPAELLRITPDRIAREGDFVHVISDTTKTGVKVTPVVRYGLYAPIEGVLYPWCERQYVSKIREFLADLFGDRTFPVTDIVRGVPVTKQILISATPRPAHMLRAIGISKLIAAGADPMLIAMVFSVHRDTKTMRKHYAKGSFADGMKKFL